MPSLRTIWRIDGMTTTTAIDHARLAPGLRLHVAHSPLTTVAMQIGDRQQYYVVLDGCPGCLTKQCRIGCRAALFRRLFATCMVGVDLSAVAPPQGFARRPYRRGALARPGPDAQSLDTTLLHLWNEARLLVQWTSTKRAMRSSALLLTSEEDLDPAAQLRAAGWMPLPLSTRLVLRYFQRSMPPLLPWSSATNQCVSLLMPASRSEGADQRGELSDTAASSAD
jgi:hypothetical protein